MRCLSPDRLQERQQQILRAVLDAKPAPSVRELQAAVGLNSRAQTQKHLAEMEASGLLSRVPMAHRSLRVTALGRQALLDTTAPQP
jgi:SOS-response transcriptional repressor LexA